jgi:hypothetical protein
MNAMQRFFVGARHSQVFAFLMGLSFVAGLMIVLSEPAGSNGGITIPTLIIAELAWVCFVVWFWCLGSFLYSLVKPNLRLSLPFFRFALVYPLVYMAVFQIIPFEKLTLGYGLAVFPFHLFAVFCLFFDLKFVSKSLALAETGRETSFYDYAGPIFLLWFFPLGIWFVQPRINRLYAALISPSNCIPSSLRSE